MSTNPWSKPLYHPSAAILNKHRRCEYFPVANAGLHSILHGSFSALKMDGKPLYEYARAGIPLPRPIEKRPVRVDALELKAWLGNDHAFRPPTKALTVTEKENVEVALASVASNPSVADLPGVEEEQEEAQTATTAETSEDEAPTAFELSMTVSGGTYVRSIVHDLAHAVGSAGHVVTLTRTRQGRFALNPESTDETFGCVPWDVFERASKDVGDRDDEGWTEWEREVRARMEVVE
jgi:tRNA pseudouridine55 synthase